MYRFLQDHLQTDPHHVLIILQSNPPQFCATGQMGFSRQLTSDEIFEQAYHMSSLLARRGERLSNVVFMGTNDESIIF